MQTKSVPNYLPVHATTKLAIIGEAPGVEEVREGRPFVGASGRMLSELCARYGVNIANVFLGNVCQIRPPGNVIANFEWNGDEIQSGLAALQADLLRYQPTCCLLLGASALRAAANEPRSVNNWRGSIFRGMHTSPIGNVLCVSSFHPAACLRQYNWKPLLNFDIGKAVRLSQKPNFSPPEDRFKLFPTADEVVRTLEWLEREPRLVSVDIEGYWNAMSCLSIAWSPQDAIIIPFSGIGSGSYFEKEEDEVAVWKALSRFLSNPKVPKLFQNGLYDRFVFLYGHRIVVRGVVEDTMIKHWERYCELPKSLDFQTSIYTNRPYYKDERTSGDAVRFWTYCCTDSAVTYEINNVLTKSLVDPESLAHYRHNMLLSNAFLYMEVRGIRYNAKLAAEKREKILQEAYEYQRTLDEKSGVAIYNASDALKIAVESMAFKKMANSITKPSDLEGRVRKPFVEVLPRIITLIDNFPSLSRSALGELSTLLKVNRNVDSPFFRDYLYDELKLPKQFKKEHGRLTETTTADYHALLKLAKKTKHEIPSIAIQIRERLTRAGMLAISADPDGRVRAGYNHVGSETARVTCYTSPTGSGYNLQTIPDKDRDCFLADEGYDIFQCDLSGADGWTVACNLASLGERTMLEDYLFGLKPYRILALMLRHGASISNKPRPELAELSHEVKKHDWDAFACKQGQHGTCYLMGPRTLADRVFIESEGKVSIDENDARHLQGLFMHRYRVKVWHNAVTRKLQLKPELRGASGHKRWFFGRREEILGEALANEPQVNTTYATSLAMKRLWTDPENRTPEGKLIIEPLHQVHDALVGQWPQEKREWARAKVRGYFNNQLVIAGIPIVIPFEGGYGPDWKNTDVGEI